METAGGLVLPLWVQVLGAVGGVLMVVALAEAAYRRSGRWVLTILLLPMAGAIGWFVAGRRFYRPERG